MVTFVRLCDVIVASTMRNVLEAQVHCGLELAASGSSALNSRSIIMSDSECCMLSMMCTLLCCHVGHDSHGPLVIVLRPAYVQGQETRRQTARRCSPSAWLSPPVKPTNRLSSISRQAQMRFSTPSTSSCRCVTHAAQTTSFSVSRQ